MGAKIIPCQFNLFHEGRTYSGHHRKYILESAISTCYAPQTRERLQLREALGYFGHGRRELSGRLALPEVSTIKLPDGSSMIVENIPSNVTVSFEVAKDGTVKHEQQILETEPGKIVAALNDSKVGGFSWACGGVNGGLTGATKVNDFHGFDYVMNPGFADNRGYILESADSGMILESVAKATGMDDAQVDRWMKHWTASAILENATLQEQLIVASMSEDAIREELEQKALLLESAQQRLGAEEARRNGAKSAILEAAKGTVIAIPDDVLHAMLNMSTGAEFQRVVGFFESARQVNVSGLPLGGEKTKRMVPNSKISRLDPKEYGNASSAPEFDSAYL